MDDENRGQHSSGTPGEGDAAGEPASSARETPPGGGYSWEMRYKAAQSKADEYFANWQRAAADIANLRRQTQRERDEVVAYARASLIADLLPVLDQMERVAMTAPPFVLEDNWVRGVSLLERHLRQLLERRGLQPITCNATQEQLDPSRHLAVVRQPVGGYAAGTVVAELQRGYTLGDMVLRPTLVAVADAPAGAPDAAAGETPS